MADALFIPMTSSFESSEEQYFDWWLQELKDRGFIEKIIYQPDSYVTVEKQVFNESKELKTKTKWVEKTLVRERVYTPDYKVYWNVKAANIFYRLLYLKSGNLPNNNADGNGAPFWANEDDGGVYTVFEVKGLFDSNNMTRLASINIDIVFSKYDVKIEMAKVGNKKASVFYKTFTPRRFLMTDKSTKERKIHYTPTLLEEYVTKRQEELSKIDAVIAGRKSQ